MAISTLTVTIKKKFKKKTRYKRMAIICSQIGQRRELIDKSKCLLTTKKPKTDYSNINNVDYGHDYDDCKHFC